MLSKSTQARPERVGLAAELLVRRLQSSQPAWMAITHCTLVATLAPHLGQVAAWQLADLLERAWKHQNGRHPGFIAPIVAAWWRQQVEYRAACALVRKVA